MLLIPMTTTIKTEEIAVMPPKKMPFFRKPEPPPPPTQEWEARNFVLTAISIAGSIIVAVGTAAWHQTVTFTKFGEQVNLLNQNVEKLTEVMYTKEQALIDARLRDEQITGLKDRMDKLEDKYIRDRHRP